MMWSSIVSFHYNEIKFFCGEVGVGKRVRIYSLRKNSYHAKKEKNIYKN